MTPLLRGRFPVSMVKGVAAVLVALQIAGASPVLAGWVGPTGKVGSGQVGSGQGSSVTNVAAIKAAPMDERKVVVEGRILSRLDKDHFVFDDGTGKIRVEIDDDIFPPETVSPETRVRLDARVDVASRGEVELDVKRLTIIR